MIQFLGEVRERQGAEKKQTTNSPFLVVIFVVHSGLSTKKFVFLQQRALSIVGRILQFSLAIEIVHTSSCKTIL